MSLNPHSSALNPTRPSLAPPQFFMYLVAYLEDEYGDISGAPGLAAAQPAAAHAARNACTPHAPPSPACLPPPCPHSIC